MKIPRSIHERFRISWWERDVGCYCVVMEEALNLEEKWWYCWKEEFNKDNAAAKRVRKVDGQTDKNHFTLERRLDFLPSFRSMSLTSQCFLTWHWNTTLWCRKASTDMCITIAICKAKWRMTLSWCFHNCRKPLTVLILNKDTVELLKNMVWMLANLKELDES